MLLRKVTHKRALRRLQDMDTDQDLSELVNELLTEWLERQAYFHTYGNPEIQTYGNTEPPGLTATRRQPGNRLCLFDLSA